MSKAKKKYICNNCGVIFHKWSGQCFECGSWGSIIEEVENYSDNFLNGAVAERVEYISEIKIKNTGRIKTNIAEFDRAVGGGLVKTSVLLIGGDPGIGKSTLLLQIAAKLSENNFPVLYLSAEESTEQIKIRAERLGIQGNQSLLTLHSINLENILATILQSKIKFELVIIDSIQTIKTNQLISSAGTISQIKLCSNILTNYAKKNNFTLLISCHVNKEGELSGPKMLEHMVDTVLYFEGNNHSTYRILRTIKNRFGNVNEIGVFEMLSCGLKEINNPSEEFLINKYSHNVSGNSIFAGIEGSRVLLLEIQALINKTNMATPRRSVVGWDYNRLAMIIAVLSIRLKMNLMFYEIYLNVAGGLKIAEPAADLAVAMALISAYKNIPINNKSVFFGEISLSGAINGVSYMEKRINEARKLGYQNIYCYNSKKISSNNSTTIHNVDHLSKLKDISRIPN